MATAQSLKTGQAPVECHFCKGGTKVRWKCLNCDVSMCNRCKDNVHSKLKIASHHVVVDIKELGKHGKIEEAFPFSGLKCIEHKGQVCCLFCKTCRQLICPKCMAKVHNGHPLIEQEEYNKKRENLKAEQIRIEEILDKLVIDKEKLTKVKEAENDKYAKIKKEIFAQKNRLLEEVSHRWKSISNAIEQKEFQVEEEMKQIQKRNGNVQNLITTKDFGYFFEQVDKIQTSGEKAMPPTGIFNVNSMPTYIPGKIVKLYAEQPGNIEFKISNEYTTDLKHIHYIAVCSDGTIWIADNVSAKLQHVKLEGKIEVISNLNLEIFGLAATLSNDALIATIGKKLKIVSSKTGRITDSIYAESSLFPSSIHITKDGKIILGTITDGTIFPATGRRTVIVMNHEGKHLREYEFDRHNKPLFTVPMYITSTNSGDIFVVDKVDATNRGRLVILDRLGDIIQIYTGQPDFEMERKPFNPRDLIVTPSDTIIVADINNNILHCLNYDGQIITYYDMSTIGIKFPHSLGLLSSGTIFVGCITVAGSKHATKANIFELEYSEIEN